MTMTITNMKRATSTAIAPTTRRVTRATITMKSIPVVAAVKTKTMAMANRKAIAAVTPKRTASPKRVRRRIAIRMRHEVPVKLCMEPIQMVR